MHSSADAILLCHIIQIFLAVLLSIFLVDAIDGTGAICALNPDVHVTPELSLKEHGLPKSWWSR